MTRLPVAVPNRVVESFWGKVVKSPSPGGCWVFTGAISSPDGYGRINFRVDGLQYSVSAPRFALMLSGTDISNSDLLCMWGLSARVRRFPPNAKTRFCH